MPRLTRQESHARTRERLVETAATVFLASGYHAASLERVAAEAGYTKGAVYSSFPTKHALGLAVLDAVRSDRALRLADAISPRDSLAQRLDAFAAWAEENIGDVGWTAFEVEFATSTRHLDGVAAELAERRRTLTALVADLIARQAEELGIELAIAPDEAAIELLALGIGLGVQRAFDPSLPVTSLVTHLRRLAEAGGGVTR